MNDLVAWLLEQIAEDERVAHNAQGILGVVSDWWTRDRLHEVPAITRADARHMAHWTPKRALAECDAKRRHVAWLVDVRRVAARPAESADDAFIFASGLADKGLKMLALPYVDRPGYREEWRP